jgi:hypothetical protein
MGRKEEKDEEAYVEKQFREGTETHEAGEA